MSHLTAPDAVVYYLQAAKHALSEAHIAASEEEGSRTDLNGLVRDMIFGLNTSVEALEQMIAEQIFSEKRVANPA